METVKIRCKDIMVGDYIANRNGSPMQIVAVDEDNAYACEGNEERPWIFGDYEGCEPQPIILTPEILEKNGWKRHGIFMDIKADENFNINFSWTDRYGESLFQNGYYMCDCKYVHTLQHALRLCGLDELDELADNFKVYEK